MHATIDIYATYGVEPSTNQLIGWLIVERVRKQCHLEMRAIAEHQQLAYDVLLATPSRLTYLGPVEKTALRPWEVLKSLQGDKDIFSGLPAVTDPIDLHILEICLSDPDITGVKLAEIIGLSRGATSTRRTRLKMMGHKVK